VPRARRLALTSVLVATAWGSAAAGADDKQACIAAHEQAQQLRNADKLRAAREQLDVCGRAVCPSLVRSDCAQWTTDVIAATPTVVFAAHDWGGRDLVDVRVRVDGAVVTELIDGKSVPVDPGVHRIEFDYGQSSNEQQVVIRKGEHDRIVSATLGSRGATATQTDTPASSPTSTTTPVAPEQPTHTHAGIPVLAPILAGLGVVALGAALYLDLDTTSRIHAIRDSGCAPNCDQSTVDGLNARYPIAAIIAGAGVVALGAAAWVFLTRPKASTTDAGAALGVRTAAGGGVAELRVTF
jgi:hypothetical protein